MKLRCPHCQNPVEVVDGSSLVQVDCPSCHSRFSLAPDETVLYQQPDGGSMIAHFELLEKVGTGAFGTVWKARDTKLDRIVAIKVPRKDQLDKSEVEQFLREARAVAQLKHTNIVTVHEVGRDGDTIYMVSDFVEGLTLADRMTGTRLSTPEALELCIKVAEALHHAHENGVIHRDLKPGNIMLETAGVPHVMDFGLAKRDAGEITMTIDGKILGTPAYMSPEQARGEASRADRTTDVYSLGVILFELLTGERPFRGNTRMLLHQVLNEDAPSPRKLNANIPKDLETICLKCMEKDPHRRYPTARELADELRRYLDGKAIHARPISSVGQTWKWCKRNPVISSLSAALVASLMVGLIAVSSQWLRAESERDRAETERQRAEDEVEKSRRQLYLAHMKEIQQTWELADVGRVVELLNRHRPRQDQEDLRGFEWYYWWRECHRSVRQLEPGPSETTLSLSFSPDGKMLATGGLPGTIMLWDVATGDLLKTLLGHSDRVYTVAFSPDGQTLASCSWDGTLKLWDVEQGTLIENMDANAGRVAFLAFSRDGTTLASAHQRRKIKLWDVGTGDLKQTIDCGGPPECVAFSVDGTQLAWGSATGQVIVWDVEANQRRSQLEGHSENVVCVAFSPNGKTLASGGWDDTLRLWDLDAGQEKLLLEGHRGNVNWVSFAPDGKSLASASDDRTVRLWNVSTGKEEETFKGHSESVLSTAFSPDGTLLASGSYDGTVKFWNLDPDRPRDLLSGHDSRISTLAVSPDGKTLASAGFDRKVNLWDVATGDLKQTLQGHYTVVRSIDFSPDGKTLAAADASGRIVIWETGTGEKLKQFKNQTTNRISLSAIAYSPDGKTLAAVGGRHGETGKITLWDVPSGKVSAKMDGHEDNIACVEFSPDGRLLATGSWDFSVKLWDAATHKVLKTFEKHQWAVEAVAFSPDGSLLAAGGRDRTISLWNVRSRRFLRSLKGHNKFVLALAFAPDGRTLASGSQDSTARLWDLATGRTKLTWTDHTGPVRAVSFSRDGTLLATASDDQTIRLRRAASKDTTD